MVATNDSHLSSFWRTIILSNHIFLIILFILGKSAIYWCYNLLEFYDTYAYTYVASSPFYSQDFWAGGRPLTVPLIYKLAGYWQIGTEARVNATNFQFVLAILCWITLGLVIKRIINLPTLKPLGLAIVLGFGLSTDISQWDRTLLSESVSISLFALLVAVWLIAIIVWQTPSLAFLYNFITLLVSSTTFFWSFTRDSNMYLVLGLGFLMLGGLFFRAIRQHMAYKQYAGMILILFGIFLAQNHAMDVKGMKWNNVDTGDKGWMINLQNVLGQRILPNSERTAFFVQNGMPVDANVMRFAGKFAGSLDWAWYKDPKMAPNLAWLRKYGKITYLKFLLSNFPEVAREPLTHLASIFSPDLQEYVSPKDDFHAKNLLNGWVAKLTAILYPKQLRILILGIGSLFGIATILIFRGKASATWLVPYALLLLVYPMIFITWHGDAVEIGRHSLLVAIQLRLAGWLLLLFFLDKGFEELGRWKVVEKKEFWVFRSQKA